MNLPNFLIIGAPKSGTSSLYHYLGQHPEIYMSPVKEPHFFALDRPIANYQGIGDRERMSTAISNWEDYQALFAEVKAETAIGEASTTYLGSSQAPEKIKATLPGVKLIAIIRNPADAAYASFLHLLRDGDEYITDFGKALDQEEKRIAQGWESLWHYRTRNYYYQQFKRYFDLFSLEQIKVYLYEDFKVRNQEIVTEIFDFLDVDSSFIPDYSAQHNVSAKPQNLTLNRLMSKPNPWKSTFNFFIPPSIRNQLKEKIRTWNFNDFQKPEYNPEIRQVLLQGYRSDILRLQDLIDRDLSIWFQPN